MEIKDISKLSFFFIIGRPRSGTTLLRTLMDAHPNVVIPQESPVILNLHKKYKNKIYWSGKQLDEFYNDLKTQNIFGVWNVDKDKLHHDLLSCEGDNRFQDLIQVLYLNFNSIYKKDVPKIIGDKNPVYSYNFKSIFKIYPNAKYIHLVRDYRDQIVSMKRMDLEMSNPALVSYRWKLSWKQIAIIKTKFPKQFYTLKYEDLVQNFENELKAMCDFLGIPFSQEVIRFYEKTGNDHFLPEITLDRYHQSLFKPIGSDKVNVWMSELKQSEIKIADWVVGRTAASAGYERSFKSISFSLWLKSVPLLIYGWCWNYGRQCTQYLPYGVYIRLKMISPLFPILVFRFKKFFKIG